MERHKGFMDLRTFERCIWVLKQLGQTTDLGLHHFGESTTHPKLVNYIALLNTNGITPFLNTNGDFMTDTLISKLASVRLQNLMISGHMEREKRVAIYNKCSAAGIPSNWQCDMIEENGLLDLAGQIQLKTPPKPFLTNPAVQCGFLRKELGIVLWNGDLTACCIDYEGYGIFGNIFDENVLDLKPTPFSLCQTCPGHPGQP